MKSKEALERLLKYIVVNETILIAKYGYSALNDVELIKQDLDKLEKMNDVWHKNEPMESVDINGNHLQEIYDFRNRLIDENESLQSENKKLKAIIRSLYNINELIEKVLENDK